MSASPWWGGRPHLCTFAVRAIQAWNTTCCNEEVPDWLALALGYEKQGSSSPSPTLAQQQQD
eukprot:4187536-Lingulodinium_polyedra.AAC.1